MATKQIISKISDFKSISWITSLLTCQLSSNRRTLLTCQNRLISSKTTDYPASRFPIPERDTLPKEIKDQMREVEAKGGFLPNVFKTLSHRPAEFKAFFSYYDALMEKETGNLTKADKEMIVVATSAENNCIYCVVAHSALHRIYSNNKILADQITINWRCSDLGDREKAILEFAMDVCACKAITDEHFKRLEEHGLDREDAWDIGAIVGLFALSNRMAHVTNMRPNDEFYLIGKVKKR